MATILLGAAGAALGAGFGGTVLGLSGAVIGRAIGATLGRVIDQRLLGAGAEPVEVGRVDRFRLMGASEGAGLPLVYGRTRLGGQVVWATQFQEIRKRSGGKGAPKPEVTEFSYSVSLAVALCEGEIAGVGRIWADGIELDTTTLDVRVYSGSEDQLPDPKIAAVEGAGLAPAYRGTAYVMIENLALSAFGNRVPQFSFEVIRHVQGGSDPALAGAIRAVALIPGTGEYALSTSRVYYEDARRRKRPANLNTVTGKTDFATSLDQLTTDLPRANSVSLIVSWFGDDLRCGTCTLRPKVEQKLEDGRRMAWRAGGISRSAALTVPKLDGEAVYGGTPADVSVIEGIRAIRESGREVMFYPFILMEQLAGNGRSDPYSGAADQPSLPWRGRITTSLAPGRAGTPDQTAGANAEVAAFFGSAAPGNWNSSGNTLSYSGPNEWSYRRFILHYAHLCKLAGGVDAFCIGSEMRGLTQIRGAGDSFPAVAALRQLAADVKTILGPSTKVSYAADWSEYFGYHADGNVYFHLDPLWADPAISFVGIDNYMPLSDWRDGMDHADADFGTIHNLTYLSGNVAGGEGYEWYYDSPEGRAAQRRLPIEDGAFGEPWVFRSKDLTGWWSNEHHDRIDGARSPSPTAWVPQSKPFRFTEYGCAAIDKGTNAPNLFVDPKSSESALPPYSSGRRDDAIQMQYFRAMHRHYADVANNPISDKYAGPMVDMDRAHAWAWDSRPFPTFPGNDVLWRDAGNYYRGHWLNGRATNQPLDLVVQEICARSGVSEIETGRLGAVVRGFATDGPGTARGAMQPLMLAYGFEAVERDGALRFQLRGAGPVAELDPDMLVLREGESGAVETVRAGEADMAGRVRASFVEAEGDFALRQAEAVFPDERSLAVSQSDLPLMLTNAEARGITERWLSEARVARDGARFALPRSLARLGVGDVVRLEGALYRIDRLDLGSAAEIEAVRSEPSAYTPSDTAEDRARVSAFTPPALVTVQFLDLPLLTGTEVPYAPHVAVSAQPFPGTVAVWSSPGQDGFGLNTLLQESAVMGVTDTALPRARSGVWDRGTPVRVLLESGMLASAEDEAVLNGANLMVIGDGSADVWEVIQFATAELVAPQSYDISMRLRGQAGTDATMPDVWPEGSRVVLMNGAPDQISLKPDERGLVRTYRVGASARGFDDPDIEERVLAFDGIGLRPYAPVHLRLQAGDLGAVELSWIRRGRIDADNWNSADVPLGEDREAYLVRVIAGNGVVREESVSVPRWSYPEAARILDGVGAAFTLAVAQVSDRFGPGPFRTLEVTL